MATTVVTKSSINVSTLDITNASSSDGTVTLDILGSDQYVEITAIQISIGPGVGSAQVDVLFMFPDGTTTYFSVSKTGSGTQTTNYPTGSSIRLPPSGVLKCSRTGLSGVSATVKILGTTFSNS